MTSHLKEFEGKEVRFIRNELVKEGVSCEIYEFTNDSTRDLAVVHVLSGQSTPLQKVMKGDETLEGYMEGDGQLVVIKADGHSTVYPYSPNGQATNPVVVFVGDTIQWRAGSGGLVFYELCTPPYVDGRFEDLDTAEV